MRPIPQTVQVATELARDGQGFDILEHLQGIADAVQEIVPDCIGLSIAWIDRGVSFTLVASDEEIAVLDAVQYLAGGPCVEGVEREAGIAWTEGDPLDEDRWHQFTRATAARAVRSTLTLPLVLDGRVMGSANLYAAATASFEGHADALAEILGASASDVVRNADLSFQTRAASENAVEALRRSDALDQAVGILAGVLGVTPDAARERLIDAARRAGVAPETLALALVSMFG